MVAVAVAGSLDDSLLGEAVSDLVVEAGAGDLDEESAIFNSSPLFEGCWRGCQKVNKETGGLFERERGVNFKTAILTKRGSL